MLSTLYILCMLTLIDALVVVTPDRRRKLATSEARFQQNTPATTIAIPTSERATFGLIPPSISALYEF